MDDNKTNPDENQPTPLYETVPEESVNQPGQPVEMPPGTEPLQPEEIPSDVANPGEAFVGQPPEAPPPDEPPPIYDESSSKTKYLFIAGGVVFFLFIFIILLSVIFGGKKAPKNVTLTYWTLWEDATTYEPLIKQYEQQNPNVKINVQTMSVDDYREKLSARIPDGKGPDIFRFHNTWLPELKDIMAPLPSSIMSNDDFEKTFYSVAQSDLCLYTDSNKVCDRDLSKKKGRSYYYYGIPLEIDGLVLVYNDGLFKKANIDKPPASLDELADDNFLSKLTFKDNDGKLVSSAIAIGTSSNVEHFSDIFGLLLLQNGGDLKKLDDQTAAGALEGYKKFAEAGVWDDTMPNSINAFIQEKVAMIIVPSYEILTIKAQKPDIQLKVAPVPFNLPGSQPISLANYWAEGVSIKSQNSVEAWKFLKFLSQKENMTKLYEQEVKSGRLFGEPYSRVDLADELLKNEYLSVVVQQGDRYYSLPLVTRTSDKGLNDGIIEYIRNAINESGQGVSYSQALQTASSGVNQIFTQYKIQ
jgi:multiple sugar transport system substrate-binding protein